MIQARVYLPDKLNVEILEIREDSQKPDVVLTYVAHRQFGELGWLGLEYKLDNKYHFITNPLINKI